MRMTATAALVIGLPACTSISVDNGSGIEGRYALRQAHGSDLPTALDDRIVIFTVDSGTLSLESSGEWSEVLTGTSVENGQALPKQLTEGGRWTHRFLDVELERGDGALAYSGRFSVLGGGTLNLLRRARAGGRSYTYMR